MSNVDTKHPDYGDYALEWRMMRHVQEGALTVKRQGDLYLPMPGGFAAQSDGGKEMYRSYSGRAEFPDLINPTLQGMAGLIHRREPQIKMPEAMMPLWENATPDGLSLEGLYRRITSEVLLMGRVILLADAASEGSDLPWIATYNAETLINWSADRTFFVLDESGYKRYGFEWRHERAYRELYLEGGAYHGRQYGDDLEPGQPYTPRKRGDGTLQEIPLVIIGPTDLAVEPSVSPLKGVAQSSLAIFRLDADYRHQLFMSGQETFVITGIDNVDQLPKFVGAGVIHGLPLNAKAEYVGPSCKGIEAHRTAILDERTNAVAAGARLLDEGNNTPDRESGKAKSTRYVAEVATLGSISISSAAGLEKALRHIAVMMGEDPETVIVKPNLEFFDTKLSAQEVVNLVQGWQNGGYSYQTLYENLQRGGVASEERDFKEERKLVQDEQAEREAKILNQQKAVADLAARTNPTRPMVGATE